MFEVTENTTARYTATLKDEAGAVVPASALDALTLTLYDVATGTILNERNAQDVLNKNGVSVTDQGLLTWTLEPDDNEIVRETCLAVEVHKAIFQVTWGTVKQMVHTVELAVRNVEKVDNVPPP